MKIYVASSWRNEYQQTVVTALREAGHEVYDFKNPPNRTGFAWSDIDEQWKRWSNDRFIQMLGHPTAQAGFDSDFNAMKEADVCVMVTKCGASAHTEAGWMKGAGKFTIALLANEDEPELMYKIFDAVCTNLWDVLDLLDRLTKATNNQDNKQATLF